MSDKKQQTTNKDYDTKKIVNDILESFNLPPPKKRYKVRFKSLEKDNKRVQTG